MLGRSAALLCIGMALASCGDSNSTEAIQLTEAQSGQTISATIGQTIKFTLEANLSTGYSWFVRCTPAGLLEFAGHSLYVPDKPIVPGSGGVMTYEYVAVRAGRVTVQYQYRRSWETEVPPAKSVTYVVVVS